MRTLWIALAIASTAFVTPTPLRPTAKSLLTETMVRSVRSYTGPLVRRSLEAATASYDDVHFQAAGAPESFDVALRVWHGEPDIYDNIHDTLPGVVELAKLGARAFTAEEADIFGVGFEDDHGTVVLLTCGKQQCQTLARTVELARRVCARLP